MNLKSIVMKRKVLIISLLALFSCTVSMAQVRSDVAPYNNAIGGTIGFMNGASFKTFPTNHFAIQLDLGYRFILDYEYNAVPIVLTFNPNFMYEAACGNGFYWFIGGGLNIGGTLPHPHSVDRYHHANFVFGVNAFGGAEYKFANIPLALQVDARPGFFLFANSYHYAFPLFDYNFFNVSARYTF